MLILEGVNALREGGWCIGREHGAGGLKDNFPVIVEVVNVVDCDARDGLVGIDNRPMYSVSVETLPAVFG